MRDQEKKENDRTPAKNKRKKTEPNKKRAAPKKKRKSKKPTRKRLLSFDDDDDDDDHDDDESDDLDDHGNIKGLIDYGYEETDEKVDEPPPAPRRKSTRVRKKSRVIRPEYVEIEVDDLQDIMAFRETTPPPPRPSGGDNTLTKMLLLSQLCSQVEGMAGKKKRRRRLMRSKSADETSDEDSDSSFCCDDLEDDLRDTLTPVEEKYYKKMSRKQKLNCVDEYDSLRLFNKTAVPLKFRILELEHMSMQSKSFMINRLNSFQNMESTDNEYHKLNAWFSQFEKLPMNNYATFPLNRSTSTNRQIYNFLTKSRKTLDGAVYGHEHVKDEIIQLLSSWISNENGSGQVLALQGPPGNGKTTLVKNGLSKVINRPFSLIALGGAKDSAFLQGHDYTFEGSKPGRIVEVIRDAGVMNPVIFFDEVDKLSDSPAGKEISNLLCHLLDPVQNTIFQDRYFSGIDIDLSKAVFVMSFNNIEKIDPILRDRMRVVHMKGFQASDKVKITQNYLLPEICAEFNFKPKHIKIPENVVRHVIDKYTSEQGVRDLRRQLSTIVAKLNVIKLVGKKNKTQMGKIVRFSFPVPVKFPLTLTTDHVDSLLSNIKSKQAVPGMYM